MKLFFVVTALVSVVFSANAAQAASEKINCVSVTQPNNRMQIVLTEHSTIAGVSLFDANANQTAEDNFIETLAVGTMNPMAGIQVILQDRQTLDIDYSIFDEAHNGVVILNDEQEYRCF